MTWQDRGYNQYDDTPSAWGRMGFTRPPLATGILMAVHGFAVLAMLTLVAAHGAAGVPWLWAFDAHVWPGILLHPVGTADLLRGVLTVVALWLIGGLLERRRGGGVLLQGYVLGNLAAGVAYFLLAAARPDLAITPLDYPLGALVAFVAALWRDVRYEPAEVFGYSTTQGRVLVFAAGLVVVLELVLRRAGAVAWVAGVAAAAAAALLLERAQADGWAFGDWLRRLRPPSVAPRRIRPSRAPARQRSAQPADERDVDEILAKISRSGLESLSAEERQRLEAARLAKLRRER